MKLENIGFYTLNDDRAKTAIDMKSFLLPSLVCPG
jgi:hypothetical protein